MRPEVAKRIAQIRNKQLPEGYKKVNGFYVPADWSVCSLERCARFLDDKRVPIKEDERKIGPYPYYGASGIIDYVDSYIFDGEYILLGEDGANILDRSSPLAYRVSGKCWINNHAHVLQPRDGIDIDFLTYYLESLSYERYNTGTAQPKLNQETCKKIMIALPAIDEQRKIALLLATQDKCIINKEKCIEEKQRQKKYLMQQLLAGRKRIKGFADSWSRVPLRDITERIVERNLIGNDIVLTISANEGLIDQSAFFDKVVASENKENYYLLHRNDFAYNKSFSAGHPYGAIKRLTRYEAGIVSPLYICFKAKDDILSVEFLEQYFEGGLMDKEIYAFAQEGARNHGLLNISVEDFFRAKVNLPSMEEQKQIAIVLTQADKEIELLQQDVALEKQKKKALMQLLLTGIVRVKP